MKTSNIFRTLRSLTADGRSVAKSFGLMLACMLLPAMATAQSVTPQHGDKITTSDGIYIVSGDNLITNSSFDDGFTGWHNGQNNDLDDSNFEIIPEGGVDGGPYLLAKGSGGSGSAAALKRGWAVEEGKTYVFTMWANRKSSAMNSNLQYSRILASNSETGTDTELATVKYKADTWVQTQLVFTAEKPYLVVCFGWPNSGSSFDAFFLAEVTASDELATGVLEQAIADAKNLLATTEEGNGRGQYTAEVRAALLAAIAAAEGILSTATMQEDINQAVTDLNAAMTTYKASINPPFEVGKKYFIVHSSGYYMATTGGAVKIVTADTKDPGQAFTFVPAPEGAAATGYNIKSDDGSYVQRSGSWDTAASADADITAANAIFDILDQGTYVQFRVKANSRVLGTDSNSDGSSVYSDKSGTDGKYRWTLLEYSPTAALAIAIDDARALAAATPVGSAYYEVPQSAMDALLEAIATAEQALLTVTTFDEGAAATDALRAAIAAFKASFNPMEEFDEGQTYIISHYSGLLLTATESGNATITTLAEEGANEQQLVTFKKVEGQPMTYYLRSVALGTYYARTGDWNTLWQETPDAAAAIEVVQADGKWLGLRFASTQLYSGTDASADGSLVYSDKAVGRTLSYWFIEPYVTVVLDRVAFNAAIEKANALLASMVPGYLEGQYFQEDIDAFRQVIAQARSNANKAKDQETLDAITAQLLTDIDAARAKMHDHDYMNHTELAAAIAAAERALSAAVAGDLNGQYPQQAITDYTAALAAARTVNETPDEELTQAVIDQATADLKAAAATFAAAQVKIDYAALNAQIAAAQKALADAQAFKGEGPGKVPPTAFDALQAELERAQAMVKGHTHNQAGVDEETGVLAAAIETFLAARVPCDYTELQALVDEATEILAACNRGDIEYEQEDYDELKESLERNGAYLNSTDQDAIDRAAKLLRRDIALFKNVITGIDALTAGHADGVKVRIFTAGGQAVSATRHLPAGIYVVRYEAAGKAVTRTVVVK